MAAQVAALRKAVDAAKSAGVKAVVTDDHAVARRRRAAENGALFTIPKSARSEMAMMLQMSM